MTTSTSPAPLLTGRDLLRANGLPVEGPTLWGKPVSSGGPGVFIVELPAPQPKVAIDPNAIRDWLTRVLASGREVREDRLLPVLPARAGGNGHEGLGGNGRGAEHA